jgi:ParB-like chromosome segregation protein Spo0J
MKIENAAIAEVKPYTSNPRVISDTAVGSVAESIEKFGWQQPIVVDQNNFIVAGHTRFLAAKKLGLETVPVHRASDLSEEQIKAYRLLDNKLNELSVWDDELLNAEIESIAGDQSLDSLLSLFEGESQNYYSDDLSFLNEAIRSNDEVQDKQVIGGIGDYVTMSFVMAPADRDMCLSSLRSVQKNKSLENTTQALIETLKEV